MEPSRKIILFDGVCNLCAKSVQFIVRRDEGERFVFCALQSDVGREFLRRHGLPTTDFDSLVLIEGNEVYRRSDAVLRICAGLRRPWPWVSGLRILPRAFRDGVYQLVAHRRYRWFGRADSCLVPTDALRGRFMG